MSALDPTTAGPRGWHYDEESGMFTRHPVPDLPGETTLCQVLSLPDAELRRGIAVHEAGHAVVLLALGIPIETIAIGSPDDDVDGFVRVAGTHRAALDDLLVMCAAGERAQDRWLREAGLWSPTRAWAVELLARHDRDRAADAVRITYDTELTFGTGDDPTRDLAALHRYTDHALDRLWPRVLNVAEALDRLGSLTELQAAEAAFTPDLVGGAR
ncbi:hypothetical protein AB0442_24355 [Kitasatospora sp. NPDC085895]|uniref:hypothetical protein n=1 Tax=Kitasatospora sp. NPDC085895 TaxID=3155057 RepID=UPI00344F344C